MNLLPLTQTDCLLYTLSPLHGFNAETFPPDVYLSVLLTYLDYLPRQLLVDNKVTSLTRRVSLAMLISVLILTAARSLSEHDSK